MSKKKPETIVIELAKNFLEDSELQDVVVELKKVLKQKNVVDILPHYIARFSKDLGFLDEVAYRNICINIEYRELRNKGFRICDCKEYLAKKHTRTEDTIHTILFR